MPIDDILGKLEIETELIDKAQIESPNKGIEQNEINNYFLECNRIIKKYKKSKRMLNLIFAATISSVALGNVYFNNLAERKLKKNPYSQCVPVKAHEEFERQLKIIYEEKKQLNSDYFKQQYSRALENNNETSLLQLNKLEESIKVLDNKISELSRFDVQVRNEEEFVNYWTYNINWEMSKIVVPFFSFWAMLFSVKIYLDNRNYLKSKENNELSEIRASNASIP